MPYEEMRIGRYPDRDYFWGMAFTLNPQWSNKYFDLCMESREKNVK
jgi:hypothetical protein